ncbi:hypothetical protein HPB51_012633 [Rhipicephalus microplus]|uniref:Uncharacterized protein n=1 Tax=Rhipicephalus microplus TaxID=6941 RepID=A0A9J6E0H5_RHIMP|nr:hypothetical protein HPB51_012633 [Rhipicephalus microplus]
MNLMMAHLRHLPLDGTSDAMEERFTAEAVKVLYLTEVSLDAVKDVYAMDGSIVTLRVMHGIREAHLNPNNFEKMRVPYAYQLFGPQVTRGLRFYQQDVEPSRRSCIQATLRFFEMINSIINIMSSRYARVALRLNSSAVDCLYTFLAYLTEWESHVKGTRGFLSQSTAAGFRVTIKSTLLLLEYLTTEVGYAYLMTARLNQDPLENTFGIVRQCSGNNDHPTPQQFLDTMACISFCNLVRSPDKGNVTPGTLDSLLSPILCSPPSPPPQTSGFTHALDEIHFESNENDMLDDVVTHESDHEAYVSVRSDRRLVHYISGRRTRGGATCRTSVLTEVAQRGEREAGTEAVNAVKDDHLAHRAEPGRTAEEGEREIGY